MERDAPFGELEAILNHAWSLLERGARDPRFGMHHPVLATRGLDDLPNARTVLLWRADAAQRVLYFHTDVRSPKYAELARTPWALLVFFDATAETQLRIHARMRLHARGQVTHRAWQELPHDIRRVFATVTPPGHAVNVPHAGMPTTAREEASGYANFVLLEARVLHLDWLYMPAEGHRRAAFTWADGAEPKMTWLSP